MLPRVAPAGQVSGDVPHRPFGFSGIFIVTVRSRLRPFLSRTGGGFQRPPSCQRPEPVDLERYRVRRQARADGTIGEYHLVA
jgi:hypothetical protein